MRNYLYHYCRNIEEPEYYSPWTCGLNFFIAIHAIIGTLEFSDQTIMKGNAGGGGDLCTVNTILVFRRCFNI